MEKSRKGRKGQGEESLTHDDEVFVGKGRTVLWSYAVRADSLGGRGTETVSLK